MHGHLAAAMLAGCETAVACILDRVLGCRVCGTGSVVELTAAALPASYGRRIVIKRFMALQ